MKHLTAAAASAALVGGILGAVPAQAAETVTLRPADVTHADTRSAGHNVFLDEGVRVFTDDNSSNAKATGYYSINQPLDGMSGFAQDWAGTDPEPGLQIVVDDPATEAPSDGILVYEPIYGGDLWLTNGSSQALKDVAPSHTGGSGTDNHGTLAQWQEITDLNVVSGGWSLGSGVKGSGLLMSQTYGDTTYTFTNELPTEKPVAEATVTSPRNGVAKVNVTATQAEGTQPTPKGAFYRVLRTVKGAAADEVIERSEIVAYLAKGRVRADSPDAHRFSFRKFAKVTVVSYGHVLADKAIPGKK